MRFSADVMTYTGDMFEMSNSTNDTGTDSSVHPPYSDSALMGDLVKKYFIFINHGIIDTCICLFGIVGNCINIKVFLRQGLRKSVNLSLFAMSVSDLMEVIFQVWHNFCLNPYLELADIPIQFLEVQVLTAGRPSIVMVRVTSWITVYITAERCLSVLTPLKIKQIITFRRTGIILLFIYGMNFSVYFPVYSSDYFAWKFDPSLNKTILGLQYRDNKPTVEWLINTSHFYLTILAFILVVIFTTLLVVKLKKKLQWRREAIVDGDQLEAMSSRENKTIGLVVMVATVLIICHAPGVTCAITEALIPDFAIMSKQTNIYQVIWSFNFIFHSINSSINVIVYYKMSSKYRTTFNEIFPKLTKMNCYS